MSGWSQDSNAEVITKVILGSSEDENLQNILISACHDFGDREKEASVGTLNPETYILRFRDIFS